MPKVRKQQKPVNLPEDFMDYYVYYDLNRSGNTKDIRKQLLQRQGEIRSKMTGGSLNSPEIMNKLQEAFENIAAAIKIFKNDDRRKNYDALLDAAYESGALNPEAQSTAQDLYEEIQALYMKGNYSGAIRAAMEALNNNAHDYRIYILLAQSYFALNNADASLKAVDDGLNVHPDNFPLLRAGARFANEGKQDYGCSQRYINRMMEIDPENPMAVSEQSYLYATAGKTDIAYKLVDDFLEKHPNDTDFRKDVAYDLVGLSYSSCYTKDPYSDAYIIASEEDYKKSLDTCTKAASLYNDENIQDALENARSFGSVEYNDENTENILWLFIGGAIYLVTSIVAFASNGLAGLLVFALGILLIFSGVKLRKLSYRPYWQINKFILTGQREKEEGRYITIGKIFAGYMKWCIKASVGIMKFCFRLALGWL